MSLTKVNEPMELKHMIKELSRVLEGGKGRGVLIYNKLPQYLWSVWGGELKKLNISWREFLSIVSKNSHLIAEWAVSEKISWDELLSKLRDSVLEYSRAKSTARQPTLDSFIRRQ